MCSNIYYVLCRYFTLLNCSMFGIRLWFAVVLGWATVTVPDSIFAFTIYVCSVVVSYRIRCCPLQPIRWCCWINCVKFQHQSSTEQWAVAGRVLCPMVSVCVNLICAIDILLTFSGEVVYFRSQNWLLHLKTIKLKK